MQSSDNTIQIDFRSHSARMHQYVNQTCVRTCGKDHLPLVLNMNGNKSLVQNQWVRLPTLPITRATNGPRESSFICIATRNFTAEIKSPVCNELRLFSV